MAIKYSICMVNYNMADTIYRAVSSVALQLTSEFEIVLVDDGSSDRSLEVMDSLQTKFPFIRIVPLQRDRNRKLGETRNISVREARGEYCLLHIDCDDVYEHHLISWIAVFHQIEKAAGDGILLAGQHINMARRSELMKHGPYINIFRGEDRHMWSRFAAMNKLWIFDHVDFATRLPKTTKQKLSRQIVHTTDHMITDFRGGTGFSEYIYYEIKNAKTRRLRLILFRLLMLPITWIASRFFEPISGEGCLDSHEAMVKYRLSHKGSFEEIMAWNSSEPDWSEIPSEAMPIFKI